MAADLFTIRACARCGVDSAEFKVVHKEKADTVTSDPTGYSGVITRYKLVCVCRRCTSALTFLIRYSAGPSLPQAAIDPLETIPGLEVENVFTAATGPANDTPPDLPGDLTDVYKEAADSLDKKPQRPHSAGMTLRKVLDTGTCRLDPSLKGKTFDARIKSLAKAGKITSKMAEWADEVRFGGNEGNHEEEALSTEELSELRDFTRLFLWYAFSLNAVVERRKQERAERKAGKKTPAKST